MTNHIKMIITHACTELKNQGEITQKELQRIDKIINKQASDKNYYTK